MSRNDLIGVVLYKGRYYVLYLNADNDWCYDVCIVMIETDTTIHYEINRANALVYAHDMQLYENTEYGVREIFRDYHY